MGKAVALSQLIIFFRGKADLHLFATTFNGHRNRLPFHSEQAMDLGGLQMRYGFATQRDNDISDTKSGGAGWPPLIDRSHLNHACLKKETDPGSVAFVGTRELLAFR